MLNFVTASTTHLSWSGRGLHAVLGSAGHPGPVLVRPDGRAQVLAGGGLPLGIFPDAEPAERAPIPISSRRPAGRSADFCSHP